MRNKNERINIIIAEQDTIEIHKNIVDDILSAIGFGHAMVTNLSSFSDFCFFDYETESFIVEKIKNDFNLDVEITDLIGETAMKLYFRRKNSNNIH
jgi:hypothetical protein